MSTLKLFLYLSLFDNLEDLIKSGGEEVERSDDSAIGPEGILLHHLFVPKVDDSI